MKGFAKEAGVMIARQAAAWRQQMAVLLSGNMQSEGQWREEGIVLTAWR